MTRRKRGDLVTFQRATTTQDGYGEEIETWAEIGGAGNGSELAQVFYGRGDERRQAAMEEGEQAATFQVPSSTTTRSVTLKDRIVFDGSNWDIDSKAVDTPNRRKIEFTATRAL